MSYFDNAKAIQSKIETVLAEENLVFTLRAKTYPITMIISQSQSPHAQMEILEMASDDGASSRDCALRFIFKMDDLVIQTDNRLVISDALMSKLKGLAKKLHTAYLHAYFAEDRQNADDKGHDDAEEDGSGDADPAIIDPADIDLAALDGTEDPFGDFMAEAAAPGNE